MSVRMASLFSGSSGNCTYIGSERTHLLVDAGISLKRIEEGLNGLGLTLPDINGILVTHEHTDHIAALPVIARKHGIPVYATAGTAEGILAADTRGYLDPALLHFIRAREEFALGDFTIRPVEICHDAKEPVAYTCTVGDRHLAVATDLGHVTEQLATALSGMDALLVEANHDVRMLQAGPYPYRLKQRILSDTGHLSNEAAGNLLTRILHDGIKGVLLGHLSKENNLPELAFETVRVEIEMSDTPYHGNDFLIDVAPRSELSRVIAV